MGLSGKGLGQANVVISIMVLDRTPWCQPKMWIRKKSHTCISFTLDKVYGLLWDVKSYGRCHKEIMLGYLAISISRIFLNAKVFIEHLLCSSL